MLIRCWPNLFVATSCKNSQVFRQTSLCCMVAVMATILCLTFDRRQNQKETNTTNVTQATRPSLWEICTLKGPSVCLAMRLFSSQTGHCLQIISWSSRLVLSHLHLEKDPALWAKAASRIWVVIDWVAMYLVVCSFNLRDGQKPGQLLQRQVQHDWCVRARSILEDKRQIERVQKQQQQKPWHVSSA